MAEAQLSDMIKDLHNDLNRKWRTHGARVAEIWRSFSQAQRTKAMRAGAADGAVLKHSLDASLGDVCKFLPDYNLRDATGSSDYILDMLKHRATKTLEQQYCTGFNDRQGDNELIVEMVQRRNLSHVNPFTDCWTLFVDGDMYGKSFKLLKEKEQVMAAFRPAVQAGLFIPQSVGELILTRQQYLLQLLNILIEDILDIGSTSRIQKQIPKKSTDAATAAFSNLSITVQDKLAKLDLPYMIEVARDQKASFDDVLNLTCTEPVFLAHQVNLWFFTRPELLPDEKGRTLASHTDKYISGSVLEVIHSTVRVAAIWDQLVRLLELLTLHNDKSHRSIILQEVSNLCHFEYSRAQAFFKRQISAPSSSGSKWFKRVSNAYDNGNARVSLKGKPDLLTRENPQLHYMLRLCQPGTTASKSVDWIKKLDDHHNAHPGAIENLGDREADALGELAVIVSFIQSLCSVVSMPAFNRNKAQFFINKFAALEAEFNELKPQLDLADYVVPIDTLKEPGMAEAAIEALDKFVIEKTGTKMGFLYQDVIDQSFTQLSSQLAAETEKQLKAKVDKQSKDTEYVPFPPEPPKTAEVHIQERKEKEKTRPAHSSAYDITTSARASTDAEAESSQPQEPLKITVKDSTFKVFSTLLSSSQSRGSVSWTGFEAAMSELGFSILPRFGSVYTFNPPNSMANQRRLTLHRPHNSHIEGYKLLLFARRLKKVYGWQTETFQVV